MGNSPSKAQFRFRPLVIITVLVLGATAYSAASIVRSTYQHPTYTIHKVFQTQDEYQALQKQPSAMPGVGVRSTSVRIGPQVEADIKVNAPSGFPYGTASYDQNAMVVFPILLCVLVLGTLWGLTLQRKAKQEAQYGERRW